MKKICSSALLMLLLVSVFTQERVAKGQIFEEGLPHVGQMYYVPGEFLVKFKPDVSKQTIDTVNSINGVSIIHTSPYAGFIRLSIPGAETVADMVEIYQANDNVEYAEANYIAYALSAPNNELYSQQPHLSNSSFDGIKAETAWTISSGPGAVVAVLDTGIAYENYIEKSPQGSNITYQQAPDLAGILFVPGYDFVNNDEHPNDDSVSGHGTHIAGTIAQNARNAIGKDGLAFNACIMPVKVLDRAGAGTYADIAEGIIWATDNGAHVINLGLGGSEPSRTLEEAIAYSYNRGVTLIAAAGNDGAAGLCYPAAHDDYVIAVGATRYDETLAYYSNHGLSLDLVALGGDLNVDQNRDGYGDGILQQTYKIFGDGAIYWGYSFMEGTSMAAAHVSGVAALLIANGNASSPEQVRLALESTAQDIGPAGWDIRYGWGIVDAVTALLWTDSEPVLLLDAQTPLNADFTAEPTHGPKNTTVQFSNQSTGNFTSVLWDFGDGTTSSDLNPSHTYTDARTYTVTLTVSGPDGSDTETKQSYIKLFIPKVPDADFTREPIRIDSPMTVQFTDTSTCQAILIHHVNGTILTDSIESASHGGITTWTWSFGDGKTSNERNPSHTYQNTGSYTVSLRVVGPGGTDIETKTNYVRVTSSAPVASFNATPTTGKSPLLVHFTDTSTGNISSWLWSFGDTTTSNEQNPSHIYQKTGSYTVSLTVVGPGGSNIKTMVDYIQVTPPPPVASFTATPRNGYDPLTVQFTDISTGNISSRLWNFGDGTTSTVLNPSHTYQKTGSYTVSLTVVGPGGSNTKTMAGYIQVTPPPPVASFTATPRNGYSPLTVQFTDISTGNISNWMWNFGDGTTSTQRNPSHTYQRTGSYSVSLTVVGPGGSNTRTMGGFIQVMHPAPVANFTATPRNGDSPLTVQFTDISTGHVSSWLWDFGDGTASTEQNPIHTYTFKDTGDFTVSLTVTGLGGTDNETKTNCIHLNTPPIKVNIALSKRLVFRRWYIVTASITVTQNDPPGTPMTAATVNGSWTEGYGGAVSGVTNASGEISFTTEWVGQRDTITFTIDNVIIGGKQIDFTGTKTVSIRT